jgi:CDP-diacylglycerol---serine O-phosphatidyltransferase
MNIQRSGAYNLKIIPNLITLLNLFLGCVAVTIAFGGDLVNAALLIAVCSILDFLDGTAARILNARSEVGKQLDSLADLISFGLAPSAIAYTYIINSMLQENIMSNYGFVSFTPYVAFMITLLSAVRLARFNIDSRQTTSFIGLPTPANALFFASIPLVIAFADSSGFVYNVLYYITSTTLLLIVLVAVFSWLLVSPIHMFSLKFKNLHWKDNKPRIILFTASLLLFILFGIESFTVIMVLYILLSLIDHVFFRQHHVATGI